MKLALSKLLSFVKTKKIIILASLVVIFVGVFLFFYLNRDKNINTTETTQSFGESNDPKRIIRIAESKLNESKSTEDKIQRLYFIFYRYKQLQDYDQALKTLDAIKEIDDGSYKLYEEYARIYLLKNDQEKAGQFFDMAIDYASKTEGVDLKAYKSSIEALRSETDGQSNEEIPD